MAATPGPSGTNQVLSAASEDLIYDAPYKDAQIPTNACVIMVRCRADSPVDALIRSPQIHGSSGGVRIPIGEKEYFRVMHGGTTPFQLYATGNLAKLDWGGIATARAD